MVGVDLIEIDYEPGTTRIVEMHDGSRIVLKKLEERIDNHATFNMMQLPESRGGDDAAARIEAQTIEQIARVKTVMAQLESWRDELRQDRRSR